MSAEACRGWALEEGPPPSSSLLCSSSVCSAAHFKLPWRHECWCDAAHYPFTTITINPPRTFEPRTHRFPPPSQRSPPEQVDVPKLHGPPTSPINDQCSIAARHTWLHPFRTRWKWVNYPEQSNYYNWVLYFFLHEWTFSVEPRKRIKSE